VRSIPGSGQERRTVIPADPSRNENATGRCPVCQVSFPAAPNRRYCSQACRATAWRRRHMAPTAPVVVIPASRPRLPLTVYECPACGSRAVGEQRCECGSFMRRVGLGGRCPHCDEAVAVRDLLDEEVMPTAMS